MQAQSSGWRLFSSPAETWALARRPFAGLAPHLAAYLPMNVRPRDAHARRRPSDTLLLTDAPPRAPPPQIVRFGAYERAKAAVGWHVASRAPPAWWMPFAAGSLSGLAVALTIHPLYVVKTCGAPRRSESRRLHAAVHGRRARAR